MESHNSSSPSASPARSGAPLRFSPIMNDKVANNTEEKMFQHVYKNLGLCNFCPANEINADIFLTNLLRHRGYSTEQKPAMSSKYKRPIKKCESDLYNRELLNAISDNDLLKLADIYRSKKHLLASNCYGESTLHLAARKSNHKVVRFILEVEESPIMIDDYGRSPLTDAMWAVSPSFAVIEQLVTKFPDLISLTDVRGHTPLNYLRREHVFRVCLFLYSKRDTYWPARESSAAAAETASAQQTLKKDEEQTVVDSTDSFKRKRDCEETVSSLSSSQAQSLTHPRPSSPININCEPPAKRCPGSICEGKASPSTGSPHRPVMISLSQGSNGTRETCLLPP
mmetsp:Transcript_3159/g.5608  ORF Transcript_3159/g.5608 Transcript_3159/m.5608 type:complete len:340 (+) Transcript_3159:34-1053(+)